ncbi:MAG TPA: GNAT family N-acetyltransferase [Phenylobacterium sp.]|jgi:predicted GNAT family acetyltransferase|nr:GNAT family N-acetyltransferase [Phenylobacterium sp.]
MDHPLDRPIWSALAIRQAGLSQGDARALRYAPDYGVFAAAADRSDASLAALAALVPEDGQVALVEAQTPAAVPGTAIASTAVVWQMVAPSITAAPEPGFAIVDLTEGDAPQMLALATQTRPGPFFSRTHQLGDFVGVKQGGRLLAMAGERMKPEGYTEVSGVCTDPGQRGRGYAGALMQVVANRILARGEMPFLHSYAHNTGAIALYQALGFALRSEMTMQVLARA